ncbi:hypothetical protein [Baaleninema simplex]|uniref:hypothetical protein n=1 Tax=Baaleninema simplex TaxID=2862350 RepID=UPI001181C192|nr:hypothetical protein [Baaleninema simplex]
MYRYKRIELRASDRSEPNGNLANGRATPHLEPQRDRVRLLQQRLENHIQTVRSQTHPSEGFSATSPTRLQKTFPRIDRTR